jgi:alginate O-acetyltransferase complex protein AlgI
MLFTSPIFIFAFLPILLISYYFISNKFKNTLLLIFSLFFYAWGEIYFVGLMLFSILLNFVFGNLIARFQSTRMFLIYGVGLNLIILFIFKYFNFLMSILGFEQALEFEIHLPLGISFFTFQAISYLVDIYRKQTKPQTNLASLGLYISFFPQLIAGPIVRYNTISQQLKSRIHTNELFVSGIERFVYGLSKKVLIANSLAQVCDPIFNLPMDQISFQLAWLALICYALQIYFDFSGYSDMAIGLGRMFGFRFQENFNYPYVSKSIKEFWRRWHISLSTWFRDYLYIPLGGNRKSPLRVYLNLIIVFFLCGLWHGASWGFIIWGMIHGFFLAIERLGFDKALNKVPSLINYIYTLTVVLLSWVFFRIEDPIIALEFIQKLTYFKTDAEYLYSYSFFTSSQFYIAFIFALILSTPIYKNKYTTYPNEELQIQSRSWINTLIICVLLTLSSIMISASTYNPFIYFRF